MTSEQSQAAAFDAAVVAVADRALAESGVDIERVEVDRSCVYAWLLHDAWQFDSIPALIDHLSEEEQVAERIGLVPVRSENWFYRRMKRYDALEDAVTEAAMRAVFAVWRNGCPVPDEVMANWGLEQVEVTAEYPVSQATRRRALRQWVRIVLSDAEDALTFNRAQNAHCSITQFLGLCAHSAVQNVGLTSWPNTAQWLYDAGAVPDGSGLVKHISSLSVDEIEAQFADVHRRVLDRYREHGLFDAPIDVGYDYTKIRWWTIPTRSTIGQYNPSEDVVPHWFFAVLMGVTRQSRVCLGVSLLTKKSQYDTALEQLLSQTPEYVDIGYVLADKEFYDGSVISALRNHVDQQWLIKAQKRSQITDLLAAAENGQPAFRRNLDVTSATPRPNAVAIPTELVEQQTLASFTELTADGKTSDHTAYLTGLPEARVTPELVDETYSKRWSIETGMRQFKRGFLPQCDTRDPKVRLYLANVAMLFFNWHTLMNRVPSPQYALPLEITYHELLTAVRHVAFTECSP